MTAPGTRSPATIIAGFQGRTINHFTDLAGASGIASTSLHTLAPGQAIVVERISFGSGSNLFLASALGDIFVTDLPVDAHPRQLASIGIYNEKQAFAISMGEGQLFAQGVRITWTAPVLGIGTIPAGTTVQGPIVVTRR